MRTVERRRAPGDGFRQRLCEVVGLAFEQGRELLSREIPLVEEEERLPARRLPARRAGHAAPSDGSVLSSSTSVDVE